MVLLHNICKYFQPKNVLETGVAYGWSTLSILSALKNNNAQLIVLTCLTLKWTMRTM